MRTEAYSFEPFFSREPLTRRACASCLCSPLKAQLQAELANATEQSEQDQIHAAFSSREKAIEHDIDHKPMDVHLSLEISYNFLSK